MADIDRLLDAAAKRPLAVDISDYSDEWCAGFLAGQVHALEVVKYPDVYDSMLGAV